MTRNCCIKTTLWFLSVTHVSCSWEPIVKYINQQYEQYLKEELNVNRKRPIPDSRVHCCIYFLPATGHRFIHLTPLLKKTMWRWETKNIQNIQLIFFFLSRLRPIDNEFMKRLGAIVSIVPVIAKADTLTIAEREGFKERVRNWLYANVQNEKATFAWYWWEFHRLLYTINVMMLA